MAEIEGWQAIATIEASIAARNVEAAMAARARLCIAARHHPHLEGVYNRLYDEVSDLQRGQHKLN